MKVKIETDEYTIYERRDGRFAVKDSDDKSINETQKIEILLKHELIVAPPPKKEASEEEKPAAEAGEAVDKGEVASGDDPESEPEPEPEPEPVETEVKDEPETEQSKDSKAED